MAASDAATRERAWDAFLASYSRLLLHTARSDARDHDAAMDAYAHLLAALQDDDFRRLRAYSPVQGSKFTTWLVMVTRRLCVDHFRARYGQPRSGGAASERLRLVRRRLADLLAGDLDPDDLAQPAEGGPEAELRSRELQTAVEAAVGELDARDRLLVALRFDDDLPAREIAAIMRFPTPFHVYRRLNGVLAVLKESLRRRGIEGPEP